LLKFLRKLGLEDPGADLGAARRQRRDIFGIDLPDVFRDPLVEAVCAEELAESLRGGGEATRNADSGVCQSADHFA
jgi:hypothetical protein